MSPSPRPPSHSIFANACPMCHQGEVYNNFFFINKYCSNCNFKFEREEGYFLTPMIISYGISLLLTLPIALVMVFKYETPFTEAMMIQAAFIIVTGPVLYRYSKLLWLHLETAFDKKMQAEKDRASAMTKDATEKR